MKESANDCDSALLSRTIADRLDAARLGVGHQGRKLDRCERTSLEEIWIIELRRQRVGAVGRRQMQRLGFERDGLGLLRRGRAGIRDDRNNAVVDQLACLRGRDVRLVLVILDDELDLLAEHAALVVEHLGAQLDAAGHRLGVEFRAGDAVGDDADLDRVLRRRDGALCQQESGGDSPRRYACIVDIPSLLTVFWL